MPDIEDTPPTPHKRARWILWALVAVVSLGLGLMLYTAPDKNAVKTTEIANAFGGAFTLVDPAGKEVTDQSLKGKPFAIFFGFTRCPDVCPTTLSAMARYRKELGPDGDKFNIVFVSVDPEQDTPQDIGKYLTLFDTPIIGLSARNAQELDRAVRAYHVFYKKVPIDGGSYTIDHTASVFLMDQQGKFVTTIGHDEAPELAMAKLKRLVRGG